MTFHAQLPQLPSRLTADDERQVLRFFGSADRSILAGGTQSIAQLLFFPSSCSIRIRRTRLKRLKQSQQWLQLPHQL